MLKEWSYLYRLVDSDLPWEYYRYNMSVNDDGMGNPDFSICFAHSAAKSLCQAIKVQHFSRKQLYQTTEAEWEARPQPAKRPSPQKAASNNFTCVNDPDDRWHVYTLYVPCVYAPIICCNVYVYLYVGVKQTYCIFCNDRNNLLAIVNARTRVFCLWELPNTSVSWWYQSDNEPRLGLFFNWLHGDFD